MYKRDYTTPAWTPNTWLPVPQIDAATGALLPATTAPPPPRLARFLEPRPPAPTMASTPRDLWKTILDTWSLYMTRAH